MWWSHFRLAATTALLAIVLSHAENASVQCKVGDKVVAWYPNNHYYHATLIAVDVFQKKVKVSWADGDKSNTLVRFGKVRKQGTPSKKNGDPARQPLCLFSSDEKLPSSAPREKTEMNKRLNTMLKRKKKQVVNKLEASLKDILGSLTAYVSPRDLKELEKLAASLVAKTKSVRLVQKALPSSAADLNDKMQKLPRRSAPIPPSEGTSTAAPSPPAMSGGGPSSRGRASAAESAPPPTRQQHTAAVQATYSVADVADLLSTLNERHEQPLPEPRPCSSLDGPFCWDVNRQHPAEHVHAAEGQGWGSNAGNAESWSQQMGEAILTALTQSMSARQSPAASVSGKFRMSGTLATAATEAATEAATMAEDDAAEQEGGASAPGTDPAGLPALLLRAADWVPGHLPEGWVQVGLRLTSLMDIPDADHPNRAFASDEVMGVIIDEAVVPWGTPMKGCDLFTLHRNPQEASDKTAVDDGSRPLSTLEQYEGLWQGWYECHGHKMRLNLTLSFPAATAATSDSAEAHAIDAMPGGQAAPSLGAEREEQQLEGIFHFFNKPAGSTGISTSPQRPPDQLPRSTSNGCRCLDRWQYNGHVFTGGQCGSPDESRSSWCFIVEGSCGGVPAGDNWDECDPLPPPLAANNRRGNSAILAGRSAIASPQLEVAEEQFVQQFLDLLQSDEGAAAIASASASHGGASAATLQAMLGGQDAGDATGMATVVVTFDKEGNPTLAEGVMSEEMQEFLQQQMAMIEETEDS